MTFRNRGYALALAVFAIDQLTKWLMTGPLGLREVGQIVLLPIFAFTYTENNGVSLGLLSADTATGRWLLVALTAGIATGVAVWMTREKNRWDIVALGLVLGGALGNIVDRARRYPSGSSRASSTPRPRWRSRRSPRPAPSARSGCRR